MTSHHPQFVDLLQARRFIDQCLRRREDPLTADFLKAWHPMPPALQEVRRGHLQHAYARSKGYVHWAALKNAAKNGAPTSSGSADGFHRGSYATFDPNGELVALRCPQTDADWQACLHEVQTHSEISVRTASKIPWLLQMDVPVTCHNGDWHVQHPSAPYVFPRCMFLAPDLSFPITRPSAIQTLGDLVGYVATSSESASLLYRFVGVWEYHEPTAPELGKYSSAQGCIDYVEELFTRFTTIPPHHLAKLLRNLEQRFVRQLSQTPLLMTDPENPMDSASTPADAMALAAFVGRVHDCGGAWVTNGPGGLDPVLLTVDDGDDGIGVADHIGAKVASAYICACAALGTTPLVHFRRPQVIAQVPSLENPQIVNDQYASRAARLLDEAVQIVHKYKLDLSDRAGHLMGLMSST